MLAMQRKTSFGRAVSFKHIRTLISDLLFKPNEVKKSVAIEILHDREKEHREALTVHLKAEQNTEARIEVR